MFPRLYFSFKSSNKTGFKFSSAPKSTPEHATHSTKWHIRALQMILRVWKWSQSWAVALRISNLNSFKQCSPSQSVKHTLREDRDTPSNEAWWNNIKVLWNGQVPTLYWFPLNDHALVSVLFFFHSFHKNFPYRKHQQSILSAQRHQKIVFSSHDWFLSFPLYRVITLLGFTAYFFCVFCYRFMKDEFIIWN